jgi:hypothetical protein
MCERLERSQLQERERCQVKAAILLVADGHYPGVVISNLPDARLLAGELHTDAVSRGISVTAPVNAIGTGYDVVVRRA